MVSKGSFMVLQLLEINNGKVEDFLVQLEKTNALLSSQHIDGLNFISGGFRIEGEIPTFQLLTSWKNFESEEKFLQESAFYRERLEAFQKFSNKPIFTRAVQASHGFDEPAKGKTMEVFSSLVPKAEVPKYVEYLKKDVLAGAQAIEGFLSVGYGYSDEEDGCVWVIVLIVWESLAAHQKFMAHPNYPALTEHIGKATKKVEMYHVQLN